MTVLLDVCIECGLCEVLVPGILDHPGRIPATAEALEAMAQCPVGAIQWLEGVPPMPTLDVTRLAPRERHPRIFALFDGLRPGESFEIINDHDPGPLYWQLQGERPAQAVWETLESGPKRWRVRITRAEQA